MGKKDIPVVKYTEKCMRLPLLFRSIFNGSQYYN
jgi:hypothetical protein